MDLPCGINPLLSEEKERLQSEYITLHRNAQQVIKTIKSENSGNIEHLWYMLLTDEKLYESCKFVNFFSLQFLNRSFNECIVESEVSSVENIQTSKRHLKDENAEKLNFISSNGPHPLVSLNVVNDMLSTHFGNDWHFTISKSPHFISKTVDKHFKNAKAQPNSLQ